jgi:hypothetical protein
LGIALSRRIRRHRLACNLAPNSLAIREPDEAQASAAAPNDKGTTQEIILALPNAAPRTNRDVRARTRINDLKASRHHFVQWNQNVNS